MDDINVEAAFDAVARAALRRGEQDDDLYDFLLFLPFLMKFIATNYASWLDTNDCSILSFFLT